MRRTLKDTGRVLEAKGYRGKNMFNKTTVTTSRYINGSGAVVAGDPAYYVSDYIPVISSQSYRNSRACEDGTYTACFDINKTYISVIANSANPKTYTMPANTCYFRFSSYTIYLNEQQLELGTANTAWTPYFDGALNANSLVDRTGKNNGTFSNVSWVQLPSGVWVNSFNGANSYIQIADSYSMRMTTGGTISCWIYPKGYGQYELGRIIDKGTNINAANGYKFSLAVNGRVQCSIDGGIECRTGDSAAILNTWQHVLLTFDATGRHIYVNSVDKIVVGSALTVLPPDVSGVVRMGKAVYSNEFFFDGYISNMKIYNYALTQSQITDLFNSQCLDYGIARV